MTSGRAMTPKGAAYTRDGARVFEGHPGGQEAEEQMTKASQRHIKILNSCLSANDKSL